MFELFEVFWYLNDPITNRLCWCGLVSREKPACDRSVWSGIGLYDFDSILWLQTREVGAAALISEFVTDCASSIINCGGTLTGTAVRRAPLLKSANCCAIYPTGNPARLAFSGRPAPSGRWQYPQAYTPGLRPCSTTSGIAG